MGFESTLPLKEHEEDKREPETSQVVCCESTVSELVKKGLTLEAPLLVCMESKEATKSVDTVCDPELYKYDDSQAVTPRAADTLKLTITSSEPLDDNLSSGCQTPRESIFDPFAPVSEDAAFAPKKKVIRGAEVVSRRQLNFESGDYPVRRLSFDLDDAEEEDQFYLLVLEHMILDLVMPDGLLNREEKTPDSQPLLTGIATTCPDAPIRPPLKAYKLSPSIVRKIDFDSVSDSVCDESSVAKDNN